MSSEFAGDYVEKDELLGLNQLGCVLGKDWIPPSLLGWGCTSQLNHTSCRWPWISPSQFLSVWIDILWSHLQKCWMIPDGINSIGATHVKCSEWGMQQFLEIFTWTLHCLKLRNQNLKNLRLQVIPAIPNPSHPGGNKTCLWLMVLFHGKGRKGHLPAVYPDIPEVSCPKKPKPSMVGKVVVTWGWMSLKIPPTQTTPLFPDEGRALNARAGRRRLGEAAEPPQAHLWFLCPIFRPQLN